MQRIDEGDRVPWLEHVSEAEHVRHTMEFVLRMHLERLRHAWTSSRRVHLGFLEAQSPDPRAAEAAMCGGEWASHLPVRSGGSGASRSQQNDARSHNNVAFPQSCSTPGVARHSVFGPTVASREDACGAEGTAVPDAPQATDSNLVANRKDRRSIVVSETSQQSAAPRKKSLRESDGVARATDDVQRLEAELERLKLELATLEVAASKSPMATSSAQAAPLEETAAAARMSTFAQRKATLAAFRRASMTSHRASAIGDPKAMGDKAVPALAHGTAEAYFNPERRAKTAEDVERMLAETDPGRVGEVETLQRLRDALANEQRLFQETVDVLSAAVDHDKTEVDRAISRQRMKLHSLESRITKLIAAEVERANAAVSSGVDNDGLPFGFARLAEESSSDSSDSDFAATGREVELCKMADGSIRLSFGVQINVPTPEDVAPDMVLEAIAVTKRHEDEMRGTLETLSGILRQLERCNEALESEIYCSSCRELSSDLSVLWPCGHQYCAACLECTEVPSGGYSCAVCHSRTTDIPVPNAAINDLVARMMFKHSAVHNLFDAVNRFRKESSRISNETALACAGLYGEAAAQ